MDKDLHSGEAVRIRRRLARLSAERETLEAHLAELDASESPAPDGDWLGGPVSSRSSASKKIELFRFLFRGREDVFPKRWENSRTGKTGYAQACGNEWKARLCGKPRVKCGARPWWRRRRLSTRPVEMAGSWTFACLSMTMARSLGPRRPRGAGPRRRLPDPCRRRSN